MNYHAKEEDVYVFQRFRGEKVVVLVAETTSDGCWEGWHFWSRALNPSGEVLNDKFEVWKCFGEGDASVAAGSTELKPLVKRDVFLRSVGKECNIHRRQSPPLTRPNHILL